jgi:flagellar motility protein MotE (MotC chaperone)
MKILQSSWFVALLGCLLYLGTTAFLLKPEQFKGAIVAKAAEIKKTPDDSPSWRYRNPEFDQWVQELNREKDALAVKAQQLQELQTRLEAERQELSVVTQAVSQMQSEFDRNVLRFKSQEADNLKKQVKLIAAMSPDGAAAMLREMPNDEIVKLLFIMKSDQASLILDSFSKMGRAEAKRAADITERIRNTIPPTVVASKNTPAS